MVQFARTIPQRCIGDIVRAVAEKTYEVPDVSCGQLKHEGRVQTVELTKEAGDAQR